MSPLLIVACVTLLYLWWKLSQVVTGLQIMADNVSQLTQTVNYEVKRGADEIQKCAQKLDSICHEGVDVNTGNEIQKNILDIKEFLESNAKYDLKEISESIRKCAEDLDLIRFLMETKNPLIDKTDIC